MDEGGEDNGWKDIQLKMADGVSRCVMRLGVCVKMSAGILGSLRLS